MAMEGRRRQRSARLPMLIAVATVAIAACGGTSEATDTVTGLVPDKGSVTVLTWEGYHDQAMLDEYSSKSGVNVTQITAGSVDEMFAKAQSAEGQIDLVYFDLGNVDRYYKAGLLEPLDPSMVPNVKNSSKLWIAERRPCNGVANGPRSGVNC